MREKRVEDKTESKKAGTICTAYKSDRKCVRLPKQDGHGSRCPWEGQCRVQSLASLAADSGASSWLRRARVPQSVLQAPSLQMADTATGFHEIIRPFVGDKRVHTKHLSFASPGKSPFTPAGSGAPSWALTCHRPVMLRLSCPAYVMPTAGTSRSWARDCRLSRAGCSA